MRLVPPVLGRGAIRRVAGFDWRVAAGDLRPGGTVDKAIEVVLRAIAVGPLKAAVI